MAGPQDLVDASRRAGIRDERVLGAIAQFPRADFVPADIRERAYLDAPIPLAHDQVTTQPSLVARMLEGLALRPGHRVLEIGTGSGWQTALLAMLASEVVTIEWFVDLAEAAIANLRSAGIARDRVELVVGDGSRGFPGRAPYDAILVAAAYPAVPPPLVEQLRGGGRLVQPVGRGGEERVVAFEKVAGRLVERAALTGAHFVRLRGVHGFGDER